MTDTPPPADPAATKPNWVRRMGSNAYDNMISSEVNRKRNPLWKRGLKVLGTGMGVAIGVNGAQEIGQVLGVCAPSQDEQGREIKPDFSNVVSGGIKLALATGLIAKCALGKTSANPNAGAPAIAP